MNDEEEEETQPCEQCGGEGVLLGALGNTKHYRCRDCGWTFQERTDK